jgi:hypothetical protein
MAQHDAQAASSLVSSNPELKLAWNVQKQSPFAKRRVDTGRTLFGIGHWADELPLP